MHRSVLSVDENHGHGTIKRGVKLDDKIKLRLSSHLHSEILHALELLCFLFDGEVLEVADEALRLLQDRISVGRRVEAVLRIHIQLTQMLLQLQEALVVGLLEEKLISLIVDDHL